MARPIGNTCGLPLKPLCFKAIFSYTHFNYMGELRYISIYSYPRYLMDISG